MNFRRDILGAVVLAALGLSAGAALWGCKGDTAAAVVTASAVAPPPVLRVLPVGVGDAMTDPTGEGVWSEAVWTELQGPLHDSRTTPPTKVASLYTATHLYVAFVCAEEDVVPTGRYGVAAEGAKTGGAEMKLRGDRAEIWLDTSAAQNGTDVFCVRAGPGGATTKTWYRCSAAPEAKEDGSPNMFATVSEITDCDVPGLEVKAGRGMLDGKGAWTVVVGIPLGSLPRPLQVGEKMMKEGARWRVNLLRVNGVKNGEGEEEVTQANLSPVWPGCEEVSPYRMAEMVLEGAGEASGTASAR